MSTSDTILLAEDNQDDVLLVRRAFQRCGFVNPIEVVPNGVEAIKYLKGQGDYGNREMYPIPSVLLLDLKMPILSGFDVLKWVRSHPEWKVLPVIVLTTSFYGPDIDKAYDLGANSFLTKSVDLDEFIGTIRQLGQFWLHSKLPTSGPFVPAPVQAAHSSSRRPAVQKPRPASPVTLPKIRSGRSGKNGAGKK